MRDKSLKLWCRGPESNRYAPFGAQDFKSYDAKITTSRNVWITETTQALKHCFEFLTRVPKNAVLGECVSSMSANFLPLQGGGR